MKSSLVILAGLALAGSAFAETRSIETGAFHAIRASGPYTIEITRGETQGVTVEGRAAAIEHMRAEVSGGGVLHISQRCFLVCTSNGRTVTVRIVTGPLDAVAVAMGAQATATTVAATSFSLSASMGGEVEVSGPCGALEVSASMGGVVRADALTCRTVSVSASMGGVVDVAAQDSIAASSSMGGEIDVTGQPAHRQVSTSMGGNVSLD